MTDDEIVLLTMLIAEEVEDIHTGASSSSAKTVHKRLQKLRERLKQEKE